MIAWLKKPYQWMSSTINSPYADFILGALFYIEAIFFIPTDPILIVYCLERQKRAFTYATIALFGSVLGGISSYMIGLYLWNTCGQHIIHNHYVNYILTPERFYYLASHYQKHEWIAIFIAGFTPIPYKAATLAAGFCNLSLVPFIISSIVARGARFYALAAICSFVSEQTRQVIQKYFNLILLCSIIIIIITVRFFT